MPVGLRESLTLSALNHLSEAMNWVIPGDSSEGAGCEECVSRLLALIDSQDQSVGDAYRLELTSMTEADLADPANRFAAMFIDHVRDVYYGHAETGSWADIGFIPTDQ